MGSFFETIHPIGKLVITSPRKETTNEQKKKISISFFMASWLFCHVGLHIKMNKQDKKGNCIQKVNQRKFENMVQTSWAKKLESPLDDKEDELADLEFGNEGFPWARDPKGGEEVVGVHQYVNESVIHGSKVGITIREVVQVQPPNEKDGKVVVNVQDSDLVKLLSKGHDDSIEEFVYFRDIKHPNQKGHGSVSIRGDTIVAKKGIVILECLRGNADS